MGTARAQSFNRLFMAAGWPVAVFSGDGPAGASFSSLRSVLLRNEYHRERGVVDPALRKGVHSVDQYFESVDFIAGGGDREHPR
jgi:hypothetical protein